MSIDNFIKKCGLEKDKLSYYKLIIKESAVLLSDIQIYFFYYIYHINNLINETLECVLDVVNLSLMNNFIHISSDYVLLDIQNNFKKYNIELVMNFFIEIIQLLYAIPIKIIFKNRIICKKIINVVNNNKLYIYVRFSNIEYYPIYLNYYLINNIAIPELDIYNNINNIYSKFDIDKFIVENTPKINIKLSFDIKDLECKYDTENNALIQLIDTLVDNYINLLNEHLKLSSNHSSYGIVKLSVIKEIITKTNFKIKLNVI